MKTSVLILAALVLAGCASKPKPFEFPVSPMMVTAYTEGAMTITWKAESNQTYTVYYTDATHGTRAEWTPLPQANALRGAGAQITVSDKVKSESARRYLLLSGDQTPY